MAESLKCSPKTIMTLLTGCSPIQNLFCVKKVSNMTDKKKKITINFQHVGGSLNELYSHDCFSSFANFSFEGV